MSGDIEEFDVVVVGAGLRGLTAALRIRRDQPSARLLVVDAAAQPGGSVRTQRTNGFVCELGPFAFRESELATIQGLLQRPPSPIPCLPGASVGAVFTGEALEPVAVDPPPWSFRSGNEELVQACRRELGAAFRLGRATVTVDRIESFVITLGGEVPTRLLARQLVLALPHQAAGRLLGRFDPALAAVAERVTASPSAMAFLGGSQAEATTLRGYGILPAEGVATPVREVIFCSEVFPGRALPGRFLLRAELGDLEPAASDDDVLQLAEAEVRRWTGTPAEFGLRKLHRFQAEVGDGALVECRIRLRDLALRLPGLTIA